MGNIKIRIHKGGDFEIETENMQQSQCRATVEAIATCVNGSLAADEDRPSLPEDPTQYLNI